MSRGQGGRGRRGSGRGAGEPGSQAAGRRPQGGGAADRGGSGGRGDSPDRAGSGRGGSADRDRGGSRHDFLYGRNPVREALLGPRAVYRVWASRGAAREFEGAQPADDEELERLCGSADHQGVCAEVDPYAYADPAALLAADDALVVALDEVQDPRNLGAVCRVAECAGAAGVVIPQRRSADVTPVVCKASAGAVEHLKVARVRNLADWLATAKEANAWVYGAAADGVPYERPDYRGRVVVVFGSEGRGLRPRVAAACDELIALPLRGSLDSLNVSSAASAVVYGILHFRRFLVDRGP